MTSPSSSEEGTAADKTLGLEQSVFRSALQSGEPLFDSIASNWGSPSPPPPLYGTHIRSTSRTASGLTPPPPAAIAMDSEEKHIITRRCEQPTRYETSTGSRWDGGDEVEQSRGGQLHKEEHHPSVSPAPAPVHSAAVQTDPMRNGLSSLSDKRQAHQHHHDPHETTTDLLAAISPVPKESTGTGSTREPRQGIVVPLSPSQLVFRQEVPVPSVGGIGGGALKRTPPGQKAGGGKITVPSSGESLISESLLGALGTPQHRLAPTPLRGQDEASKRSTGTPAVGSSDGASPATPHGTIGLHSKADDTDYLVSTAVRPADRLPSPTTAAEGEAAPTPEDLTHSPSPRRRGYYLYREGIAAPSSDLVQTPRIIGGVRTVGGGVTERDATRSSSSSATGTWSYDAVPPRARHPPASRAKPFGSSDAASAPFGAFGASGGVEGFSGPYARDLGTATSQRKRESSAGKTAAALGGRDYKYATSLGERVGTGTPPPPGGAADVGGAQYGYGYGTATGSAGRTTSPSISSRMNEAFQRKAYTRAAVVGRSLGVDYAYEAKAAALRKVLFERMLDEINDNEAASRNAIHTEEEFYRQQLRFAFYTDLRDQQFDKFALRETAQREALEAEEETARNQFSSLKEQMEGEAKVLASSRKAREAAVAEESAVRSLLVTVEYRDVLGDILEMERAARFALQRTLLQTKEQEQRSSLEEQYDQSMRELIREERTARREASMRAYRREESQRISLELTALVKEEQIERENIESQVTSLQQVEWKEQASVLLRLHGSMIDILQQETGKRQAIEEEEASFAPQWYSRAQDLLNKHRQFQYQSAQMREHFEQREAVDAEQASGRMNYQQLVFEGLHNLKAREREERRRIERLLAEKEETKAREALVSEGLTVAWTALLNEETQNRHFQQRKAVDAEQASHRMNYQQLVFEGLDELKAQEREERRRTERLLAEKEETKAREALASDSLTVAWNALLEEETQNRQKAEKKTKARLQCEHLGQLGVLQTEEARLREQVEAEHSKLLKSFHLPFLQGAAKINKEVARKKLLADLASAEEAEQTARASIVGAEEKAREGLWRTAGQRLQTLRFFSEREQARGRIVREEKASWAELMAMEDVNREAAVRRQRQREELEFNKESLVILRRKAYKEGRPFIGCSLAEKVQEGKPQDKLSVPTKKEPKLTAPHLVVDSLYIDGPAYSEGVRLNDTLSSLGGELVLSLEKVREVLMTRAKVGGTLEMVVQRKIHTPHGGGEGSFRDDMSESGRSGVSLGSAATSSSAMMDTFTFQLPVRTSEKQYAPLLDIYFDTSAHEKIERTVQATHRTVSTFGVSRKASSSHLHDGGSVHSSAEGVTLMVGTPTSDSPTTAFPVSRTSSSASLKGSGRRTGEASKGGSFPSAPQSTTARKKVATLLEPKSSSAQVRPSASTRSTPKRVGSTLGVPRTK